jgi:hypothetical protein
MKFLGRDREEYNLSCDYMSKNNASIELGSRFRLLRSNSSIAINNLQQLLCLFISRKWLVRRSGPSREFPGDEKHIPLSIALC